MVPLAAVLPMVATMAQGTAKGFGDLAAAGSLFGDEDKKRLAELKRRELLGQLGYTQEELGAARNEMLAPLQAQAREIRQTATLDSQGGDALKAQIAREDKLRHDEAAQMGRLETLNAQEATRQKEEERQLEHAKDQRKAARNAALLEILTGGLAGGAQAQQIYQSQRADQEAYEALMNSPLGEQLKTAGINDPRAAKAYLDMMGEYGIGLGGTGAPYMGAAAGAASTVNTVAPALGAPPLVP